MQRAETNLVFIFIFTTSDLVSANNFARAFFVNSIKEKKKFKKIIPKCQAESFEFIHSSALEI